MGDDLNVLEEILNNDPEVSSLRLSTLITERYSNVNCKKEISRRLHSPRYANFESRGEDP